MTNTRLIAWLILILSISILAGVLIGPISLTQVRPDTVHLILGLRISRVFAAVIVGMCLGAAGATLQGALSNPLADPYILGVSSGAGVGAATAVALSPPQWLSIALPSLAITGSLLTMALVVGGVRIIGRHTPAHFLLVGIAVNASFSALTLLLLVASGPKMNWVLLWLMGDFSQVSWHQLVGGSLVCLFGVGALVRMGRALDAMSLGDETATAFGFNVGRSRLWAIIVASTLTATAVSMGGIIGFVALVAPHIVRALGIRTYQWLVLVSGLGGATALVICDLVARSAMPTTELPIGVVTALLGTPFFFFLLWRRRHVG
ncbi:iron ABC transporter permease [bacterium]|nr:iron ABC transporter permease [bacterium]